MATSARPVHLGHNMVHSGHNKVHLGHNMVHLGHNKAHLGPNKVYLGHNKVYLGHSMVHLGHNKAPGISRNQRDLFTPYSISTFNTRLVTRWNNLEIICYQILLLFVTTSKFTCWRHNDATVKVRRVYVDYEENTRQDSLLLLGARSQNCGKRVLASSCLSVCLSVPTGLIFMKYHTWLFFEKSIENWRIKNQLDATWYLIVLLIGSICFGH